MDIELYTKEKLIERIREIARRGWIPTGRAGNDGSVGNTLEDLLGITENNLPIPNAAEWELKAMRRQTTARMTLMHMDPSPRAAGIVARLLLPNYGWPHQGAGTVYGPEEMSFRQTICARGRTDRGFGIYVDRAEHKLVVSFDATAVAARHSAWLERVRSRAGLGELNPQPYWGFDDLYHKVGAKLHNCFLVEADTRKMDGHEEFRYSSLRMLRRISQEGLIRALENGHIFVDFDARSGHNHGTKFRIYRRMLPELYAEVVDVPLT